MIYAFLADIVLIIHATYVFFVVGGMMCILTGAGFGWAWTKNFWFRVAHLAAIGGVILLSWLQIICPLTTLESFLRQLAGQPGYNKTFIAYWLHQILFYEAESWVFSICYTVFGLAVVLTWAFYPPDRSSPRQDEESL